MTEQFKPQEGGQSVEERKSIAEKFQQKIGLGENSEEYKQSKEYKRLEELNKKLAEEAPEVNEKDCVVVKRPEEAEKICYIHMDVNDADVSSLVKLGWWFGGVDSGGHANLYWEAEDDPKVLKRQEKRIYFKNKDGHIGEEGVL